MLSLRSEFHGVYMGQIKLLAKFRHSGRTLGDRSILSNPNPIFKINILKGGLALLSDDSKDKKYLISLPKPGGPRSSYPVFLAPCQISNNRPDFEFLSPVLHFQDTYYSAGFSSVIVFTLTSNLTNCKINITSVLFVPQVNPNLFSLAYGFLIVSAAGDILYFFSLDSPSQPTLSAKIDQTQYAGGNVGDVAVVGKYVYLTGFPSLLELSDVTWAGIPSPSERGEFKTSLIARDAFGRNRTELPLNLIIDHFPRVITRIDNLALAVGSITSFFVPQETFEDPEPAALQLVATSGNQARLPSWVSFGESARVFTFTPNSNSVGNISISLTATAGQFGSATTTFFVYVGFKPEVQSPIPRQVADLGVPFSWAVPKNTFVHPSGQPLQISTSTLPPPLPAPLVSGRRGLSAAFHGSPWGGNRWPG